MSILPYPEWITNDLAKSGISEQDAWELGFRHVSTETIHRLTGVMVSKSSEGYTIPFLDPESKSPLKTSEGKDFVRVKLKKPAQTKQKQLAHQWQQPKMRTPLFQPGIQI